MTDNYVCVECGATCEGEPWDFEGWEAWLSEPGQPERPLDDIDYCLARLANPRCQECVEREAAESAELIAESVFKRVMRP